MQTFDFAVVSSNTPEDAIKHISIPAESLEIAQDFASQELADYKDSLSIKEEEFEQKSVE